ncbi:xylose isomerase isoform X2 [Cherax quadricarinatus]|uniref:xylose isomerase isoform X2 n=1 Tax=Cherax quadricarinatus TaxID=27406 RepID=UPI002379770F|nr:xylose isomerase-like isoform X2 [Cherax quadricarinatus]
MNKYFPGIGRVEYRPDAGPEDTLVFRHYNATETVHGRSMEEWLRFSVCYFNTFRYLGSDNHYGERAHQRAWEDASHSLDNYKRRMIAAFELLHKLTVRYYSVSDRDMAPEGDNFDETNSYLEEMVTLAAELQKQTGIKPLYYSADLFTHPRYMNGAGANPDAHVFAYACAQVKRSLEAAKRLGAENFVFFNPRDGYQSVLQRQFFRDMSHMAQLYRMAAQYKDKISYKGQLLIQPKPSDPRRHQYEADAMATMHMLRHFGLEKQYKLYIKPAFSRLTGRPYEHDVYIAAAYNMLGSVDASDSFPELKATSDICARDVCDATYVMKCVLEQGGLQHGGFTLGGRVRRESVEPRDLFHGHILAMDTFARALKNAARMISDGCFARSLQHRYSSYKSGFGERVERNTATLEDCEDFVRKNGEPELHSARYEHFENGSHHNACINRILHWPARNLNGRTNGVLPCVPAEELGGTGQAPKVGT